MGMFPVSYFYNFNRPASNENTGRGFDVASDEFMSNKPVMRLEHRWNTTHSTGKRDTRPRSSSDRMPAPHNPQA